MGFVKSTINRINVDSELGLRVALETFSDSQIKRFHLNQYRSKERVMNAMNIEYTPGTTDTAGALR